MKHFLLTVLTIWLCLNSAAAAAGFFSTNGTFAIVNGTFYDLNATTGNPDFSGANLGTFAADASLFLGGQAKTFKNNSTDVTGVSIYYRYYPTGSPSGGFTAVNYGFQWNSGDAGAPGDLSNGGDQQWGTDIQGTNGSNLAVDIFAGTTPAIGNYTLEVYTELITNGVNEAATVFENNGGANYTATFTITAAAPVTFSSFAVRLTRNGLVTHFTTASETDNAYFAIERSTDSRRWTQIGRLAGAGTTQVAQAYEFLDAAPLSGLNYYRIKQVDYDGSYTYSSIVSARWDAAAVVRVFPNPVSDRLTVSGLPAAEQTYTLEITDAGGRRVLQAPWQNTALNVSNLEPGTYWLLIYHGRTVVERLRFVKR